MAIDRVFAEMLQEKIIEASRLSEERTRALDQGQLDRAEEKNQAVIRSLTQATQLNELLAEIKQKLQESDIEQPGVEFLHTIVQPKSPEESAIQRQKVKHEIVAEPGEVAAPVADTELTPEAAEGLETPGTITFIPKEETKPAKGKDKGKLALQHEREYELPGGKTISGLTEMEGKLLQSITNSSRRRLRRDTILVEVWGKAPDKGLSAFNQMIGSLREKLSDIGVSILSDGRGDKVEYSYSPNPSAKRGSPQNRRRPDPVGRIATPGLRGVPDFRQASAPAQDTQAKPSSPEPGEKI